MNAQLTIALVTHEDFGEDALDTDDFTTGSREGIQHLVTFLESDVSGKVHGMSPS